MVDKNKFALLEILLLLTFNRQPLINNQPPSQTNNQPTNRPINSSNWTPTHPQHQILFACAPVSTLSNLLKRRTPVQNANTRRGSVCVCVRACETETAIEHSIPSGIIHLFSATQSEQSKTTTTRILKCDFI